jgi:hypothetical protein
MRNWESSTEELSQLTTTSINSHHQISSTSVRSIDMRGIGLIIGQQFNRDIYGILGFQAELQNKYNINSNAKNPVLLLYAHSRSSYIRIIHSASVYYAVGRLEPR